MEASKPSTSSAVSSSPSSAPSPSLPTSSAPSWLAQISDIITPWGEDIPFFVEFARSVPAAIDVLELACGAGRISLPLLEAGIHLTCVDVSPDMLGRLKAKLEEKKLTASVLQQDIAKLKLSGKTFELVFVGNQSFAEIVNPSDRQAILSAICEHLSPTGKVVIALYNPSTRIRKIDGLFRIGGHYLVKDSEGKQCRLLVQRCEYLDPASGLANCVQLIEQYGPDGVLRCKRHMETHFALVAKAEFESMVAKAGMHVVDIFGDYKKARYVRDESQFMIYVLKKGSPS